MYDERIVRCMYQLNLMFNAECYGGAVSIILIKFFKTWKLK